MKTRLSSIVCGALSLPLLLSGGSLRAEQSPAQPALYAAYVLLAESSVGSTAWSPFLAPCAPGGVDQAFCVKPATAQKP